MKTLALVLSLAAVTVQVQADVLIYQINLTNSMTGGGRKYMDSPIVGRLAIDLETATLGMVQWLPFATPKKFGLECPTLIAKIARGNNQRSHSAWFIDGSGYDEAANHVSIMRIFLRGVNTSLDVGVGHPVSAPAILRGVHHGSGEDTDGATHIGESPVLATYLEAETIAANAASETVADVMERWRQNRISKGFVEWETQAPCF